MEARTRATFWLGLGHPIWVPPGGRVEAESTAIVKSRFAGFILQYQSILQPGLIHLFLLILDLVSRVVLWFGGWVHGPSPEALRFAHVDGVARSRTAGFESGVPVDKVGCQVFGQNGIARIRGEMRLFTEI